MDILLLVTVDAALGRLAECAGGMAVLAGHAHMQPYQREASQVVIEADGVPPSGLAVTGSAFAAERAAMHVVDRVAARALLGKALLTRDARMTGMAGKCRMRTTQGELRPLSVIESLDLPAVLTVAVAAFSTHPSRVRIRCGMTAVALSLDRRFQVSDAMAAFAVERGVPAAQRVAARLLMVEAHALPVGARVAAAAVLAA
jgi:hypothetical protein